jgi:hypothetical protein
MKERKMSGRKEGREEMQQREGSKEATKGRQQREGNKGKEGRSKEENLPRPVCSQRRCARPRTKYAIPLKDGMQMGGNNAISRWLVVERGKHIYIYIYTYYLCGGNSIRGGRDTC